MVLTDSDGALTLGLDRELSAPFTLHVGTVPFAYEDAEASASEDGTRYTYSWDQAGLVWSTGENLGLRLTTPARPLTAVFEDTPQSHDSSAAFTFELRFSEEFTLSYKTLRDHAFTVTGGTVSKARRLAPPGNVRWEITVLPNSNDGVTVVLPVTRDCGDEGAVCTEDGRMLSTEVTLTVAGPAGEEEQTSPGNNPATGAPTIRGTARVGATLAYYNSPDSVDAQWYVFVATQDGELLGHYNAGELGQHLEEMLADGSFKATEDGIWVTHEDVNPATGEVEDKHFWLVEHDGLMFGSGWHHDESGS